MKRVIVVGLLTGFVLALSGPGPAASSASAACRQVRWFAWYKDSLCLELAIIFAWKGWDLVDTKEAKEIEPGVLCVKVEGAAPSDYDGPNCGASEEHEGTGEYLRTQKEGAGEEPQPPRLLATGGAAGTTFTDKSGASKLEGKTGTVACESSTSTGGFSSEKLGTFDILFLKCNVLGLTCTGLTDSTSGSVLMLGTFHLRVGLPNSVPVIVYSLNQLHMTCSTTLLEVKGCVAGKVTPTNKKLKTTEHYTAEFKKAGTDKNEFTEISNDSNTAKSACILETAENGGTFSQSALETTDEMTLSRESEIMA